jgi:hypothetical protein
MRRRGFMEELAELEGAGDAEVVRRASQLLPRYQDAVNELSRMRREAIQRLLNTVHPSGSGTWTLKQIGELAEGISPERVRQLVSSGPKPERVLLGTGAVTVAAGSKLEGPRAYPSDMLTAETIAASRMLEDTANAFGLKSKLEIVPYRRLVNLNRTNLAVIGSPRLIPVLSQILGADPRLRFDHDDAGWYLTEDGNILRSPSDSGAHEDYAYLGRLPRPDSRGTFLYLAGIHAMGTKGAAEYFTTHLSELYEQVRRGKWSVLIRCVYDPDTREIHSTEPITPVYTF